MRIYQSASIAARATFFLATFAWILPLLFNLFADQPVRSVDANPYEPPNGNFDGDIVVICGWFIALAAFLSAAWQLRRPPRENLNWISAVVAGIYALPPLVLLLLAIGIEIWR
jgi:hypothetical protein